MNIPANARDWTVALRRAAIFSLLVAAMAPAQSTPGGKPAGHAPAPGRAVLYASVDKELTQYDIDFDDATLIRRSSVTLPESVQEAVQHPSKRYLYVSWSNGRVGPDGKPPADSQSGLTAFQIDPASGALLPHGEPTLLPARAIYVTTDVPGTHVLAAHNNPSGLTVYQIEPDGTIGAQVKQPQPLDVGVYGHSVHVEPSNDTVILLTRGYGPSATKPEVPGAIKIFSYKDGVLENRASIAPAGGLNFQVRHLDFHPSRPWVFITLERQNKLEVYEIRKDGMLSNQPLFVKDTLADPGNARTWQILGTVHVHPNGKFVYVANRASVTTDFEGKPVFAGGENNIAVFSINQATGEPTLIQNIDTQGIHPRTFSLDPGGRILVAANTMEESVRDASGVKNVPGSLAVFRVRTDGRLEFVRKYDLDLGSRQLFWAGIVPLP
jgi:6-phosphogluconolactonase (cycloisomerase 2 family)